MSAELEIFSMTMYGPWKLCCIGIQTTMHMKTNNWSPYLMLLFDSHWLTLENSQALLVTED